MIPTYMIKPIESHSRAQGNIFAGPPKHVRLAPLRRNFLNFFFKMVHFGVFCITERWRGSPSIAGLGVDDPSTPPSRWACT